MRAQRKRSNQKDRKKQDGVMALKSYGRSILQSGIYLSTSTYRRQHDWAVNAHMTSHLYLVPQEESLH